jgi:hypothetical protein
MAASKTIKKYQCDKCGEIDSRPYFLRHHCGGSFVGVQVPREALVGEFEFVSSYGNEVRLRHVETGRTVNIFTVDLLKVLAGRGVGRLTLTESKRGSQSCWKAQEVAENANQS